MWADETNPSPTRPTLTLSTFTNLFSFYRHCVRPTSLGQRLHASGPRRPVYIIVLGCNFLDMGHNCTVSAVPEGPLSQFSASGADVGGRVDAMAVDSTKRLQSLYVPVSDGVRLAVDVWLPVERIARGERVGTAFRATRYHRAEQPPSPEPEADSNRAAGELWTGAGFALVVADARGTGASFGSRTMELGPA